MFIYFDTKLQEYVLGYFLTLRHNRNCSPVEKEKLVYSKDMAINWLRIFKERNLREQLVIGIYRQDSFWAHDTQ